MSKQYTINDEWGQVGSLTLGSQLSICLLSGLNIDRLPKEVQRYYNEHNRELNLGHVDRLINQIILAFSFTVEAKDPYTSGHSLRVADYSRDIAKRAGLDFVEQKQVYIAGILHDIGKIGVPDSILHKPSTLTEEEYEVVKTHTTIGADILDNITEIPNLGLGARYHHERYDGKGYLGLKGEDIPLPAQIIAVADAYDAMTSNRSYRSLRPQEFVMEEFIREKGKQFAPDFADIMLDIIEEDTNYNLHG